jgi:CDP-glucose 4,6-dehydratase
MSNKMKPSFDWRGVPVLVTGASGFIGSHLVDALVDRKAEIVVLAHMAIQKKWGSNISVVRGEITDAKLLCDVMAQYQIEQVFHLAAQSQVTNALDNPVHTHTTNVDGTVAVLEAMRLNKRTVKHVCIASSDKAYGTGGGSSYVESAPMRGGYPYDVSKSCADLISQMYLNTYDLPISISRSGNVYGGGDFNWGRLIPGIIKHLYYGKQFVFRSNGSLRRDYIYVDDAVDSYLKMAEQNATGAFNFGSNIATSAREMYELIAYLMDTPDDEQPVFGEEDVNEIGVQLLDSRKANNKLGWYCAVDLEDGLKETINWYRKYFDEKDK